MIAEVLNGVGALLREGGAIYMGRGKRRAEALEAIYAACTETKLYVVDFMKNNVRDRKLEAKLARLWKAASIPVRQFDESLADKCYYKGEYWLDPDSWDQGRIGEMRIELDRVIDEAKDLKVRIDNK